MAKTKIKVLTRPSNLALQQVTEVMKEVTNEYEIIPVKSYGDKNKNISLISDIPQNFFTKELDEGLITEIGDIAIHSAKDLPYPLPIGLKVIALTKSLDNRDALISNGFNKIQDLPKNARIGTSSRQRKEEILKIKPDLKVVKIRGSIEERIALIKKGKIDALIVAVCALKRLDITKEISQILPIKTHALQGSLAVVAKSNNTKMRNIFSKMDIRNDYGKVYLVGSGCNPDYLTIIGKKILEKADIIFYDDLIGDYDLSVYKAKKKYIGKRKGRNSIDQNKINEMLYQEAVKSKEVVHLKGGDPLIFARGGEELNYLKERLIDIEVIPGITSFQVCASNFQIPLTKRYVSSNLNLLSAHGISKGLMPTQVFFMGATRIKEIKKELIIKGYNKNTPVAIIEEAGFITEKITKTDIENINKNNVKSPALVIAGNVISEYTEPDKYLYTGLDPKNIRLNGKIYHYPLIKIEKVKFYIKNIDKYKAILFTSKNAVKEFFNKYSLLRGQKIMAIGKYTKNEIENYGYKADYLPMEPNSPSVVNLLRKLKYPKTLYVTSQLSNNNIKNIKNVYRKVIYKTKLIKQPKLNLSNYSGIIFSSGSTVDSFFRIYHKIPKNLIVYTYGEYTEKKLKRKGYKSVQKISL